MAKLFGFSIEETENKSDGIISPVPKNIEDGVDNYIASGFYGQYVDIIFFKLRIWNTIIFTINSYKWIILPVFLFLLSNKF